jgi:hypothetical protein
MSPIDDLLATFEPEVAKAFRDAIQGIRDAVILKVFVDRLEKQDINGAIAALQLDPEAFAALEQVIAQAYNAGGVAAVGELPSVRDPNGNRVIWRFGVRNTEGERQLSQHSADLVVGITNDQKDGLRTVLSQGLAAGRNPTSTALDIVGRVNPVTKRREGGLLGLTGNQMDFVERARANLLSGDPAAMKQYLGLQTRDKRFDATVNAAIRDGKTLPQDTVTKIIGRLTDNNLKLRAEMLSRTETMTALGTARESAMRQQIAAGKVAAQDVTKRWRSAGDHRVRHTHRILNGQKVGIDAVFVSPSGAHLRYPGDPNAPAAEIIGCRCWLDYKVDYFASVVSRFKAEAI